MADSSSARTPGLPLLGNKKKPFANSPSAAVQGKDKKPKYEEDEDEDFEFEPTAMLGMVSEFQAAANMSVAGKTQSSFMHQSLAASFMEDDAASLAKAKKETSRLELTKGPYLEVSPSGPQLDLSVAPRLEVSSSKPQLDLSTRQPRLDLSRQPQLDISMAPGLCDISKPLNLDVTTEDKGVELGN